jgi:hypothetical protein
VDPVGISNALGLRLAVAAGERDVDDARACWRIMPPNRRDGKPLDKGSWLADRALRTELRPEQHGLLFTRWSRYSSITKRQPLPKLQHQPTPARHR